MLCLVSSVLVCLCRHVVLTLNLNNNGNITAINFVIPIYSRYIDIAVHSTYNYTTVVRVRSVLQVLLSGVIFLF